MKVPLVVRTEELSDVWNAEHFALEHDDMLAFIPQRGIWMEFDGVIWKPDDLRHVLQLAMQFAKNLLIEASQQLVLAYQEKDPEVRKQLVQKANSLSNHAIKTQSKRGIDAMISLAQPLLAISQHDFDRVDTLLAVQDGVYDLVEHQFKHGSPSDRLSRRSNASFMTGAYACPKWECFLEEVQPDAEVRFWLQKFTGYCLTGRIDEQIFLVMHGGGANGKSVFVEILKKLLGSYAKTVQFDTFIEHDKGGIRNDLAALDKVRLVVAQEGPDGARLDEGIVKQLTGGDEITARFLHREFFTFTPKFKIILVSNHKPLISGTDNGIWRRVVLVPWSVTIEAGKRDKRMIEKLEKELDGIFQWAIHGIRMYQEDGLQLPESIVRANSEFRGESDLIGHWIDDACVVHEKATAQTSVLYESYSNWAKQNGHRPLSQKSLSDRLRERGYIPQKSRGTRMWLGVGLRA